MKKTLITLAALAAASVASAATATGSTFTADRNGDFSFTLILDLNEALKADNVGNWDSPGTVYATNSKGWWTSGVTFWASDEERYDGKLFIAPSKDGRVQPSNNYAAEVTDGAWATYDAADAWKNGNIALTYTFDNGVKGEDGVRTSTMTVYVLKNQSGKLVQESFDYTFTNSDWDFNTYNFTQLTTVDQAGVIKDIYCHSGALTASEAQAFATQVIPEPATATLSLLALAGLAARRRRK